MKRSVGVSVVVFTIIALLLTACGPARQPAPQPPAAGGENFMVALPRLVLDVDETGNPVMFGINASQLGRFLGGDLSSLHFDPATVKSLTQSNVQHIEVRQVGDAAVVLVNGKPLPHIGWSDASLQQAMDVAGAFGVQNADVYRKILPLVRRLGLDLVLRFPRAAGASEIPLANPDEAVVINPSKDSPSAIARMEVKYDQNGVPGIMGISASDLARLGIILPAQMTPELLDRLQKNNIQTLEFRNKGDGAYLYVNGNPLPNVVWDDALLKNTTDLYAQMNPQNPNLDIIKLLIPFLSRADVDVLFHFPLAQGASPIPAKMHE